jgi:hypothetical protein
MSASRIPAIITKLYALVDELEHLFPERKFTLDGHLVGSIGEIAAKYFYDLNLLPMPNRNLDANTREATPRTVQIKLTAGKAVAFADYEDHPDLLVVLRIDRRTGFEEVYNGPFPKVLFTSKAVSKRKVRAVSVQQLRGEQSRTPRSLDDAGRIAEMNREFIKVMQ